MINWKSFGEKFDQREQWAFEQMSYFLFCAELDNYIGAFRYKDQPGIETEPIEREGILYAFQAKYYGTKISQKKKDIIDSIKKSDNKDSKPNVLLLYVNQELSKNREGNKPKYQIDIEQAGQNIDIKIEWRVLSHLEYQLAQIQNKWIFDIFFGANGLEPDWFKNQVEKEIKNLGPRFNNKLNFKLPIAKVFDNLSYNNVFYKKIIKTIDNWLTDASYQRLKDNEHLSELEKEIDSSKEELTRWIISFKYSLDNSILLTDFLDKLNRFNRRVAKKRNQLYEQRDWKKSPNQFDNEIGRLREIENKNNEFLYEIDELKINLANNPTLIIEGDAGSGKSHLLGDIATQRKNQFLPTILLLGTTFNASHTIEKNILNKLDLTCSFNEFLTHLNSVGNNINSRVLILIDAINEGAGADLWKNQIAGFVDEVAKYPAIGLVLTIRSTYFDDIITSDFKENPKNTFITHTGFKGNEYEALKLFCEYYELDLPNFPILNPEFSNPLFLHLICEATKNQHKKSFPKGIIGIKSIFNLFKDTLNRKFDEKRHEYKNRNIVSRAIEKFANSLFDTKHGQLECNDAFSLFDNEFPQFPHLLTDLIEECVFIKMRSENRDIPKDYISFSYQKLGDYFMAEELLKPYSNKKEIENAITNDKKFQLFLKEYEWSYRGVAEIITILLPEKLGFEFFELIDFFFEKNVKDKRNEKHFKYNTYEIFTRLLIDSLKWRDVKNINEKKITTWIEKNGRIDYDEWLYTITELSAIHEHPFNSARLFRILNRYSMPKRDGFWQKHLMYYSGYNDDNIAFPLRRLIDWAWSPNISIKADSETTRLVAQTLTWVLASTDIALRDQTTKALVNLLEQQPEVLIVILKSFEKVDDFYIQERLYAVTYGCILRTKKENSIKAIGQYVYDTIFKEKNPPAHILLRDYARNTIEYAIFKNLELDVDTNIIRPPYKTKMPVLPQSEVDVEVYQIDYESNDFKKNNGYSQNAIYNSVIGGIADFGRYIVDSAVGHFASYSFREDDNYKDFLKTLSKDQKGFVENLYECTIQIKKFEKKPNYQKQMKSDSSELLNSSFAIFKDIESTCLRLLEKLLEKEQFAYLNKIIIPSFNRKTNNEKYNALKVRYWIVKRVFDLGYDRKIHGEFDRSFSSFHHYDRHNNKVERIGKKYQWIAFYEILSMLTDHYKINNSWSLDNKYDFYKGTWQLHLRNIDPAYITKNKEEHEDDIVKLNKEWWEDDEYNLWNYPDSEWVKTVDDLIDPKQIIEKKDAANKRWLQLQYYVTWNEPKKIGVDRYEGRRKQIFFLIQGLLVRKSHKKRIIKYLENKSFWGSWLPENSDNFSNLINREKFWSPAYKDEYKSNRRYWDTIQDTNLKVIISTEPANSGIEKDKSGANQSYNIPCKYIYEKMNLQYSPVDGNLEDASGEIIVTNSNPSGVLIRKKEFVQFLEENNLDVIWTVLGEKLSFDNNRNEKSYFKVPCGVYYLDDLEIKGKLKMYDRN